MTMNISKNEEEFWDNIAICIISVLLAIVTFVLTFLLPAPFNYFAFWLIPLFLVIFIIYGVSD